VDDVIAGEPFTQREDHAPLVTVVEHVRELGAHVQVELLERHVRRLAVTVRAPGRTNSVVSSPQNCPSSQNELTASTNEPEPSQSLVEGLKHRHVGLAMRRTEQVRVPPWRPAFCRFTHYDSRKRVRLGQRHTAVGGSIEQPPGGRGGRPCEVRVLARGFADADLVIATARSTHGHGGCHSRPGRPRIAAARKMRARVPTRCPPLRYSSP
jgi:hypothetical protein